MIDMGGSMESTPIGRDGAGMPIEPSAFRVIAWQQSGWLGLGVPGFSMSQWRITGATSAFEILDALDEYKAPDTIAVAVYVELSDSAGVTLLVRIAGDDPSEGQSFELVATRKD